MKPVCGGLETRLKFIKFGHWGLITIGEQALFNLEIKKKSGSSITPHIHHSKVSRSDS